MDRLDRAYEDTRSRDIRPAARHAPPGDAAKWSDKGYWSKRLGMSVSKGTSKALKYKHLFELHFQVRAVL